MAQVEPRKKRRRTALGPHTREHMLLAGLDWRTREAKVLVAAREELTRACRGRAESGAKGADRARCEADALLRADGRAGDQVRDDERAQQPAVYLAWVNALRLALRELGIKRLRPAIVLSIQPVMGFNHLFRSPMVHGQV